MNRRDALVGLLAMPAAMNALAAATGEEKVMGLRFFTGKT